MGDMVQTLTQWWHQMASNEALDACHQVMMQTASLGQTSRIVMDIKIKIKMNSIVFVFSVILINFLQHTTLILN